ELEQALKRAEAAARSAQDELRLFAYATSHDLQEPLRSISSYAQLLERQYAGNPEAAEFTTYIVDAVNRMTVLIRDLLTYSRLPEPRKRTVSLAGLVQWAMMSLEAPIREAKVRIIYEDLPEVQADESQTVQLLQNLFSNALKYRSADPPEIEITAEEGDDSYTISVRDNGIGIEPRFHELIFGVFKRLHGREVPGTGIGLALCRKIVEGHDGKIWVESGGTKGSVFKFTLPF
ncbi:MAG TPA: ATP-binding protein, partial [Bryobacteraceae bacterium]|nr:ATP-binding protein [Bryobacteraceae bacterium]